MENNSTQPNPADAGKNSEASGPSRQEELVAVRKGVATAFLAFLEIDRPVLTAHCKRVARWARELGVLSALSDAELDDLETAALLHDIGFLSTSVNQLRQGLNDKSTDDKVKRHPLIGYSILTSIKGFDRIAMAILHHHERFDGTGFPQKLRGENIPLFSRIIAVADMFDLESHPGNLTVPDMDKIRKVISQERARTLDPDQANRFLFILNTSDDLHRHDKNTVELPFSALKPGMVLSRDLKAIDGAYLLRAGLVLTEEILNRAFSSSNIEWLLTTAYVDASSIQQSD